MLQDSATPKAAVPGPGFEVAKAQFQKLMENPGFRPLITPIALTPIAFTPDALDVFEKWWQTVKDRLHGGQVVSKMDAYSIFSAGVDYRKSLDTTATDTNETRMQYELKMLRERSWNVAFRTLDGLTCFSHWDHPDPEAKAIIRTVEPSPTPGFLQHRRYERTPESYCGLPLFQEVEA
jgi:hypothetical protein